MKKFIAMLVMAFTIGLIVNAQETVNKTFSKQRSLIEVEYSATDTLSVYGDSVLLFTVQVQKDYPVFYDVQIELDSISGTPDFDVDLKGRVFDNDTWADLETDVTWDGTSSDTTILFQEHSTAEFYTQIQLQVNGQASTGTAAYRKVSFKVWQ